MTIVKHFNVDPMSFYDKQYLKYFKYERNVPD